MQTIVRTLNWQTKRQKKIWFMQIASIAMSQWDVAFWGTSEQQTSSSSFIFPFPFYRIHLKGYSGTAGKISSIGQPGSDFSTKDADNDKCVCKCSQLTTGGKRNNALPSESVARSLPPLCGDAAYDGTRDNFPASPILASPAKKSSRAF